MGSQCIYGGGACVRICQNIAKSDPHRKSGKKRPNLAKSGVQKKKKIVKKHTEQQCYTKIRQFFGKIQQNLAIFLRNSGKIRRLVEKRSAPFYYDPISLALRLTHPPCVWAFSGFQNWKLIVHFYISLPLSIKANGLSIKFPSLLRRGILTYALLCNT